MTEIFEQKSVLLSRYKLIIFDFDGTLADSYGIFVDTINQLARKHKFKLITEQEAEHLRGMDARRILKYLDMPAYKLPFVSMDARREAARRIDEIKTFKGVDDMLVRFNSNGILLAVLSSNSKDNITRVLGDSARLISHFECSMSILGKATKLKKLLKKTGIKKDEAIYIADFADDLNAAKQVGVTFGAVSWGYGTLESMSNAEIVFKSVEEIKSL